MAFKSLSKRLEVWAQERVPILRTYLKQENLRDADKLIRDELVKRLDRVKGELDRAKQERVERGSLLHLDKLDRVTSKVDAVSHQIRFAARGYRGLFDPEEVGEDDLVGLLNFDERLFGVVESLAAGAAKVAPLSDEELLPALRDLESQLTALDHTLDERQQYAAQKLPSGPAGAPKTL
jgi:predicted transcriptional regulator